VLGVICQVSPVSNIMAETIRDFMTISRFSLKLPQNPV
jgi:hypothetical protein